MLYALVYPFSFVVLAVTFVLGLSAKGAVQRFLTGQRQPAWARRLARRRTLPWLRPFVDPYGAVAAVLGGLGWGAAVETNDGRRHPRGRTVAALLSAPVVLAGLGVAALVGFRALHGPFFAGPRPVWWAVTGSLGASYGHVHYVMGYGEVALLLAGIELLAMGVLAILPIPPLDGGRLLFLLAPRTAGWQRMRYRLEEDNWGALIVLVLAFPIGRHPIILSIMDGIIGPLIRTLVG